MQSQTDSETDLHARTGEISETMAELGDLMADLSESMSEVADELAEFDSATRDLRSGAVSRSDASTAGEFAAADD